MKNTISGNEARGFMKILVDAKTDTVIGVHMIGPDCAEIMQASWALLLWGHLSRLHPAISGDSIGCTVPH